MSLLATLILSGCLVLAAPKEPPAPFDLAPTSGPATALPAPLTPEESERTLLPPYFYRWTKERQEKWLKMPESRRKLLIIEAGEKWAVLQDEYRARDRKELVRPAPPGFKPDKAKRKLKLTLIARDKTIRKGEKFWFRLELQNVGSEPFLFQEHSSYFKDGYASRNHLPFYVIQPDGSKEEMHYSMGGTGGILTGEFSLPGWESMTDDEKKKAVEKWKKEGDLRAKLFVKLEPGESLVTRPWRSLSDSEMDALLKRQGWYETPHLAGDFRELRTRYKFNQVGSYRIQAVYSEWSYGPPQPPTEKEIKRGAKHGLTKKDLYEMYEANIKDYTPPLESNTISLEVLP